MVTLPKRNHTPQKYLYYPKLQFRTVNIHLLLTCGLSRAAGPPPPPTAPPPPPPGAEERDEPGEGLKLEEEERLDSPE